MLFCSVHTTQTKNLRDLKIKMFSNFWLLSHYSLKKALLPCKKILFPLKCHIDEIYRRKLRLSDIFFFEYVSFSAFISPIFPLTLNKAPITTAADDTFWDIFLNFWKKIEIIVHGNCLLAENSNELSCLICYFPKNGKIWNCRLLLIVGCALRVNSSSFSDIQYNLPSALRLVCTQKKAR